jgi:ABC-type Na+ efflux pump permease subunit
MSGLGAPPSMPTPVFQGHEITIAQLRTANEELQRRKADAEKDRELFRDLYNRASAHASDVSKENAELLERTTLAESRVRDGLTMIRQTYEGRVLKLQDEVDRLTKLNAILTVKDLKTNADDVRRRAAEEVNLRADNQRLRAELAELRLDYDRMEMLLGQLGEEELSELREEEEVIKHKLEQPVKFHPVTTEAKTVVVSQTATAS